MKTQEQIVKEIYAALHVAEMTWTMSRNRSGQIIIDFYNNHIVVEPDCSITVNAIDTPLVKVLYDIRNQ